MTLYVINLYVALAVSIILLWVATVAMRENRVIVVFVPLVFLGVAFVIVSAIFFYDLLGTLWSDAVGVLYIIVYGWLLGLYIKNL